MYEPYLYHFGVPGMKWGVRKAEYESSGEGRRKQIRKQYRKANSAARSYFNARGEARSYTDMSRSKEVKANLTQNQVNQGRYRVARGRSITRNILSSAGGLSIGALMAAGLTTGGVAFIPTLAIAGGTAAAAGVAGHFSTGAHYYGNQRKMYKKLSSGQ